MKVHNKTVENNFKKSIYTERRNFCINKLNWIKIKINLQEILVFEGCTDNRAYLKTNQEKNFIWY